jgi:hypothetical protein
VFKPDELPVLEEGARVRLMVETIGADEAEECRTSWETLEHLWSTSMFSSGGDCLTRKHLHERD